MDNTKKHFSREIKIVQEEDKRGTMPELFDQNDLSPMSIPIPGSSGGDLNSPQAIKFWQLQGRSILDRLRTIASASASDLSALERDIPEFIGTSRDPDDMDEWEIDMLNENTRGMYSVYKYMVKAEIEKVKALVKDLVSALIPIDFIQSLIAEVTGLVGEVSRFIKGVDKEIAEYNGYRLELAELYLELLAKVPSESDFHKLDFQKVNNNINLLLDLENNITELKLKLTGSKLISQFYPDITKPWYNDLEEYLSDSVIKEKLKYDRLPDTDPSRKMIEMIVSASPSDTFIKDKFNPDTISRVKTLIETARKTRSSLKTQVRTLHIPGEKKKLTVANPNGKISKIPAGPVDFKKFELEKVSLSSTKNRLELESLLKRIREMKTTKNGLSKENRKKMFKEKFEEGKEMIKNSEIYRQYESKLNQFKILFNQVVVQTPVLIQTAATVMVEVNSAVVATPTGPGVVTVNVIQTLGAVRRLAVQARSLLSLIESAMTLATEIGLPKKYVQPLVSISKPLSVISSLAI